MLKLYKLTDNGKEYWETWSNEDGTHTIHWGKLGTEGNSKTLKNTLFKKAADKIQAKIDSKLAEGFNEIDIDQHYILLIEYSIDGMGTADDLDKRYLLEERMNETLGWTGLGHCDGGSIGSGTMEVCNFVVDFEIAKKVIEENLSETEFSNFTRIYDENA